MKLIAEEEEHLLPDAPKARQPWYVRWPRRWVVRIFSPTGLTIAIGLLLVGMLTGLISLSYVGAARDISPEGISYQDFYAESPMEVVDREATQRRVDRSLTPVYQNVSSHNRDIEAGLDTLLRELEQLATDPDIPSAERESRYRQVAGGFPNSERIFAHYFAKPMEGREWVQLRQAAERTVRHVLNEGFTEAEADDPARRNSVIAQSIPRSGYPHRYRDLVYFMADAALEPNQILDEGAMSKNRQWSIEQALRESPEKVTFTEGQKIVGQGEKVTSIQRAALAKMGKSVSGSNWVACLGVFLLSMLFVLTLWTYVYNFKNREYFRPAYAAMLATLTAVTVVFFQLHDQGTFGAVPIFAFPLAMVALTLGIFIHPHVGVLAVTLLVFLLALAMRVDYYHASVLLFGSYMGIYILNKRINFRDRGQLMYAGLYVGATNALILMAFSLLKPSDSYLSDIMGALGWGFLSGAVSGILTIGILPLLETIFRLVTPYTLMELGNHDQPLLKRMQFEAPGTFHHSLMVATLAETAAEAIGANALLTRVGCLYHDIGKMKRPLFFIENQAYFGVENPHDKLTPRLSKMVITAHPRDSIEMAKQHKLPEILMRFMTEHHGTLTAGYFYNKACIEEGVENVNKSQFRYPGPKPASKETAIVMLADAAESAVRALKNPTVGQVEERIDKIIQQRIDDGQFDNCPITFRDINTVKQTFVRVLRGIQHNRIEYQQNMMRELGRKLPVNTITEHAGLQEVLKQAQAKSDNA